MIKIGVLGTGHLGKIHLKLLKEIPAFELVGFYDPDPEAAQKASETFGVPAFPTLQKMLDAVDAVDIVSPTLTHYENAKMAMRNFKHVFIEKPVTATVEEAKKLIKLAKEADVKAQVGHVERYNPAFLPLRDMDIRPMFIEGHRLAQWNPRGTDVSVVHDLMIHDIDIVMSLVKSTVKKVSASGVAVISETPDIANARIEFHNGCVANLTASRISLKNMRKVRIFQKNTYLSVDFLEKKTEIFRIAEDKESLSGGMAMEFNTGDTKKFLAFEAPVIEPVNSIKMELEEFAQSIQENKPTSVTLEEATAALETAHRIAEKINNLCIV